MLNNTYKQWFLAGVKRVMTLVLIFGEVATFRKTTCCNIYTGNIIRTKYKNTYAVSCLSKCFVYQIVSTVYTHVFCCNGLVPFTGQQRQNVSATVKNMNRNSSQNVYCIQATSEIPLFKMFSFKICSFKICI